MAEQRVVLIVNVGQGQAAVVFAGAEAAEEWSERQSPEVRDAIQGVVPMVSRRSVQREVKRARGHDSAPM